MKITVIYNEPSAGMVISRKLLVEVDEHSAKQPTCAEVKHAINRAGHRLQKPGYQWDIFDAVVFMFYGYVEDVR